MATRTVCEPPLHTDDELYGSRREGILNLKRLKENNQNDCVVHALKTFVCNERCISLNQVIKNDNRIKRMLAQLDIIAPLPVQQYIWPQLIRNSFPCICIGPQSSGKTYSHLLHIVFEIINAISTSKTEDILNEAQTMDFSGVYEPPLGSEENPQDLIEQPRYIIVCSSQQKVEELANILDSMKGALHDASASVTANLPPLVATLDMLEPIENIAFKCIGKDVLIATPFSLLKSIEADPPYLNLSKANKLIFDDLDISLQVQNFYTRELIKHYLDCSLSQENDKSSPQIFLFARKWTDMVKQFVNNVLIQKNIIFGSAVEAAIYANARIDIVVAKDIDKKIDQLVNLIQCSSGTTICISCNSASEGNEIKSRLDQRGLPASVVEPANVSAVFRQESKPAPLSNKISITRQINVIKKCLKIVTDPALELTVDFMTNVQHLIHFNLPEDPIIFHQRFRLMIDSLKNLQKNLITTIFLHPKESTRNVRLIYDVASRSYSTLQSTKLELRDLLKNNNERLCWRWATTGVCKLEKLSFHDKLGSYCLHKHFLNSDKNQLNGIKPELTGQFKITVTNIISPSEFYFWFNANRTFDSAEGKWTHFEDDGSAFMKKFQEKLDTYRQTKPKSIPHDKFQVQKVYGIYLPQEGRVDRIVLLELPTESNWQLTKLKDSILEKLSLPEVIYSKQVEARRIDYGIQNFVYLRNVFELQTNLCQVRPVARRGFHVGFKPAESEIDWLFSAKKRFHDQVCVPDLSEITAWIRLEADNCFWFESMQVHRRLMNIHLSNSYRVKPHQELCNAGLADTSSSNLQFLRPSVKILSESKWKDDLLTSVSRYAFYRPDKHTEKMYVLHIDDDLNVIIRYCDNNHLLIELEDKIFDDYQCNRLEPLQYIEVSVLCLARIRSVSIEAAIAEDRQFTLNRCKIINILDTNGEGAEYKVFCLDHGDEFVVKRDDLFRGEISHFNKLPFQAIKKKLSGFKDNLDWNSIQKIKKAIYDWSRNENDALIEILCIRTQEDKVLLYMPVRKDPDDPDKGYLGLSLVKLLVDEQSLGDCFLDPNSSGLRSAIFFAPHM